MKNTFGNNFSVTLFGESHGSGIGAVIDGIAPGVRIDEEYIKHRLTLRRPSGDISTKRQEADNFKILSGVYKGYSTGTPICIFIENSSQKSKDYGDMLSSARPGHADYTAECKYLGYQDARGGGHFSGRVTAALQAAGAIALSALQNKGIKIASHISNIAGVSDRDFVDFDADFELLKDATFGVLSEDKKVEMLDAIKEAADDGDSVGGVVETMVCGVPKGVGEPWFDSIESILSHALFSVPAVKGVEFGLGFGFADKKGSEANDPFTIKNGEIVTTTNNNGGINGGITNGMPITFKCAIKPTPSIYKEQDTVNFKEKSQVKLKIEGRHDPCIVHRCRPVIESVTAIALCDLLTTCFGTNYLGE